MMDYSIKIEELVPGDSCDHVIQNLNWIRDAVRENEFPINRQRFKVTFFDGELHCDCDDEEEFKAEAFGRNISVIDASLILSDEDDKSIYF